MLNATKITLKNPFPYLQHFISSRVPWKPWCLRERNGLFIHFQYSRLSEKMLSRCFIWAPIRVVKNFPPALVYIGKPL
jgi:hypothetical protein